MEIGKIKKLVILSILLISLSSQSITAGSAGRYGLFPAFLPDDTQPNSILNLYSANLYNNVYERLSLLFASDEFKDMYAPYLGDKKLEIESLYDESAPFVSKQFFTLESKQMARYLRSKYQLESLFYCQYRSIDTITIIELIMFDESDRFTTIHSSVITTNNVESVMQQMFKKMVKAITHIKSGTLEVEKSDSDSLRLRFKSSLISTEHDILRVLPVDTYTVQIEKGNRIIDTQQVRIDEDSTSIITPPHISTLTSSHVLVTYPYAVDVYKDSIYWGKTPTRVLKDVWSDSIIELFSDGYDPVQIALDEESEYTCVKMRPEWMNRTQQIQIGKDNFYRSLSGIIVSLPISIISMFLYSDSQQPLWLVTNGVGITLASYYGLTGIINLLDYYNRID